MACGHEVVDPCTSPKPIMQIIAAQGTPTSMRIPILAISNVRLNGQLMDTAYVRTRSFSLQRTSAPGVFDCTVPCSWGYEPGVYTFDAKALGYYGTTVQAVADYSEVPAGCPASHGTPANTVVTLREADSARVSFGLNATAGIALRSAHITFDDGSGVRTLTTGAGYPPHFETRNTGSMRVRFVVGEPDTAAVAEFDVPLMKDRHLYVVGHLGPFSGMCYFPMKSFGLRRPVPGADSLRFTWIHVPISYSVIIC
jgi:hypothetical protein